MTELTYGQSWDVGRMDGLADRPNAYPDPAPFNALACAYQAGYIIGHAASRCDQCGGRKRSVGGVPCDVCKGTGRKDVPT
jgi:hypothetical protein